MERSPRIQTLYQGFARSACFLLSFSACSSSWADIDFLAASLSEIEHKETRVAAEYTYFDEGLDVLDYASEIESRSKPESADTVNISISNRFFERVPITYQYETISGRVTRDGEPFELDSTVNGHRLESEIYIGSERCNTISIRDGCGSGSEGFTLSTILGFGIRKQEPLTIDCVDEEGILLGGNCDDADFRLMDGDHFLDTGERIYYPVLNTLAEEQRFYVGLVARGVFLDKLQLFQSLRYQRSKIEITTTSPLFQITESFLLNASYNDKSLGKIIADLKQEIPQDTPWYENALRYEIGVSLPFTDSLFGNTTLSFYKVRRSDYEPNPQREDYDSNIVLNMSLWYTRGPMALYIRGQASNHYLLGVEPISYNRKTNKFFEHPYGHLSIGLVFSI